MNQLTIKRFPALTYAAREAINTLCTNLSFSGENIKKVMVTSSHASEGKSFVSMNLMRMLARLGKSVVLVDADLRRSMISARYGLSFLEPGKTRGLSHWLAGMVKAEQVIYATNIEGAYMVPIGREVSNPLPLLTSGRFDQLMSSLAAQVDYVLVDAPPLGVVIDAAEISKSCDGSLLVVEYDTVHRQELISVKEQLEQTGCPILGAVLNRVPFDNYMNRKYYYRSYAGYDRYEDALNNRRHTTKAGKA